MQLTSNQLRGKLMLHSRLRLRGALVVVAGIVCVAPQLVLAQEQTTQQQGISEVVVTAERHEENLQTTPIAITALSAEDLSRAQTTDYRGVADQTTSINFTPYPSSSNMLILYMRGQGVADANQITQDGSVGLYEDGFYISRPQAETFDMADPERVEVLRGPQGTLYGRNTTGGAVNIISKKPTGEFGGDFTVDGGQRDYVRAFGTLNLPKVFDGLSSKFTILYSNLAGNVDNSGGQAFNRENQEAGRAALRWDTGGPFTADYFWEIGEIKSTPIYYQDAALSGIAAIPGYPPTQGLADNTWTPIYLPQSEARYNSDGLTLQFQPSHDVTLRSLTYYRGLDDRFYQDYAGGFSNPATAPFEGITNFTSRDVVLSNEFTEEFQLLGNINPSLNYVAGLYYFQERASHGENGTIGIPGFDPTVPIYAEQSYRYVTAYARSRAAYGQVTWKIIEPLSLTLGGRYTKDNRTATRNYTVDQQAGVFGIPGVPPFIFPLPTATQLGAYNSLSFNKFNPAGTLNMAWTPDLNTYLRIATGYKAGGSDEAAPYPPADAFSHTYAPENITTYEVGLKSYWAQHTVRANLALFYSNLSDQQLQFNVDPANLGIVQTYNAGKSTYEGAELELLWAPTPDFSFGVNDTVLSTDIKTVAALPGTIFLSPANGGTNPAAPYTPGQNIAFLFRAPYAPNNILNLNMDWTMLHTQPGSLELFLDYRYQGRQYDTVPTGPLVPGSPEYYSIPAYGLLNGKLTWNFNTHDSKKTMRLSVWGQNILDKSYQEHVIGQGGAPLVNLPGVAQTGYTYQAVAWAPRAWFGAQFEYGF